MPHILPLPDQIKQLRALQANTVNKIKQKVLKLTIEDMTIFSHSWLEWWELNVRSKQQKSKLNNDGYFLQNSLLKTVTENSKQKVSFLMRILN